MKNTKIALKELAKNAKLRLSNSKYENKKYKRNLTIYDNNNFSYEIEIKNYDISTEEKLVEKIQKQLIEEYDSISPLKFLIDDNYFKTLTDVEKERYILNLSELYLKTKLQFDQKKIKQA